MKLFNRRFLFFFVSKLKKKIPIISSKLVINFIFLNLVLKNCTSLYQIFMYYCYNIYRSAMNV